MQDSLIQALHMIEALLARCERGKDSRALVAEVGAIMETVEAVHSELLHKVESEKRTARLLQIEIRRTTKLQEQVNDLQRQIDVLTETERVPIFLPPVPYPQGTS